LIAIHSVAHLPNPIWYNEVDLRNRPTEELPALVRLRVLEIKCYLYRPLLFFAIHKPLNEVDMPLIQSSVNDAIGHELEMIRSNATTHRHHGTWYTCRGAMSSVFAIAAVLKSRRINVTAEWADVLGLAAATLNFWEQEAADLAKGKMIVSDLLDELQMLE
jgi:hypothetical protein